MAHILRLNLHALCSSRLSSPALVSKLLKSPEPRLTSWRWYGEGALLEDHCISTSDTDGNSMPAHSLVKDFEGIKGSTSMKQTQAEVPLSAAEGTGKSAKDDKWQQMVSNIRAMGLKKRLKGGDANTSSSSKSEQTQSLLFELDLPQGGASRSPTVSSRQPLVMNTYGKNLKQRNTLSQNSNQQKSKDTRLSQAPENPFQDLSRPELDFCSDNVKVMDIGDKFLQKNHSKSNVKKLSDISEDELFPDFGSDNLTLTDTRDKYPQKSHLKSNAKKFSDKFEDELFPDLRDIRDELFPDVRTNSNSHLKHQQRNKDIMPNSKSKDYSYPRASEGGKTAVQEPFHSKLPRGGDDALSSAKGRIPSISREAAPSNNNGASKQSYMVCVQNLPPTSNPAMVKSSMAVHGEVTGLFKKPAGRSDRLDVYIQFKTADAMESALAARKLQFGSKTCYIVRPDNSVFTTVLRVSRVSMDTDESQLRSVCKQYGKVDDVRKRAFGVFDVFYDVKELTNISSILSSLNEVNLNGSTLLALPAPTLHPLVQKEALKSPEGQSWLDNQVTQALGRIEAGLDVVSVLFEDLKELRLVARETSK